MTLPLTPSQTAGPFLAIGLPWADGPYVMPEGTPGAIMIGGRVLDGAGAPVTDAMVETWQADPDGRFAHPDDPRGSSEAAGFRGFGRCLTDAAGRYRVTTLRPGRLPSADGGWEAPHLDVSVFARGLLDRLGHPEISPRRELGRLSAAGQQIVSMARALSRDARLIVMD